MTTLACKALVMNLLSGISALGACRASQWADVYRFNVIQRPCTYDTTLHGLNKRSDPSEVQAAAAVLSRGSGVPAA